MTYITKEIVYKVKRWAYKNTPNCIKDQENFIGEMLLETVLLDKKFNGEYAFEKYLMTFLPRRRIDFLRKHGSKTRGGKYKPFTMVNNKETDLALANNLKTFQQHSFIWEEIKQYVTKKEYTYLRMYFYEGYSYAAVAKKEKVSPSTIRNILLPGIQKIRFEFIFNRDS